MFSEQRASIVRSLRNAENALDQFRNKLGWEAALILSQPLFSAYQYAENIPFICNSQEEVELEALVVHHYVVARDYVSGEEFDSEVAGCIKKYLNLIEGIIQ